MNSLLNQINIINII